MYYIYICKYISVTADIRGKVRRDWYEFSNQDLKNSFF